MRLSHGDEHIPGGGECKVTRPEAPTGSFAADAGFLLNAPQRLAEPAEGGHLLFFLFAQDIAHGERGYPSARESMSCLYFRWPLLRCPSLAAFGCSPRGFKPLCSLLSTPDLSRLTLQSDNLSL